jgi:hypothetical protein
VSDDPDLRSRLERIASAAGDPPEDGLERVADRRHRRLRRRRGAVAAAAALAVLAAGAALISEDTAGDRASVTASESAPPRGRRVEVPRTVEVHCTPTGIDVPVASVQSRVDGLHIRVHNTQAIPTTLVVESDRWSSGEIVLDPGVHAVRQPIPPGQLTIGCSIDGVMQRRRVDLVDPGGHYTEPTLDCDDDGAVVLRDLPVAPVTHDIVVAARAALHDHLAGGSEDTLVTAVRGYRAQRLGDATADPVVQVGRDGAVVAFVHVRGEGGAPHPPWTTVPEAEVCRSVLRDPTAVDGAGDTGGDPGAGTTGAGDTDPAGGGVAPQA